MSENPACEAAPGCRLLPAAAGRSGGRQTPRNHRRYRPQRLLRATLACIAVASAAGCDRAPSYNLLGSFFPVWLLCFLAGLVLTLLVHLLLQSLRLADKLVPAVLVYPSLTALFTMVLWLIFYS